MDFIFLLRPYQIAIFIFSLSLVGRQIMEGLRYFVPLPYLKAICIFLFIVLLLRVCWLAIKNKMFLALLLTAVYGAVAYNIVEAPQELLHFIYFGALGVSCRKTTLKYEGLLIVILVSICDELVQKILPYRTYEIRDIMMNILGGMMGYIGFWYLNTKRNPA